MPGGSGKPKRSCPMCKPHKFMGNAQLAIKHSVKKQIAKGTDYEL